MTAGLGIAYLFADWLRLPLKPGKLEPVAGSWGPRFGKPYLCYPGRRLGSTLLRAFADFIRQTT